MSARLGDLDDPDYAAYTTGHAAELLGASSRPSCALSIPRGR
jgi:hypothetical protein